MAPPVKCYTCKKQVDPKSTIQCSLCKNYFEFECAGYSEKLYRLKNSEDRRQWKCKTCDSKSNKKQTPNTNVTLRKKQSPLKSTKNVTPTSSLQSTPMRQSSDICDSHILTPSGSPNTSEQLFSRSMDHTSIDTIMVQELKDTIELLQIQLASSQNELDNTLMENSDLQRCITKLTKENGILKSLCQTPLSESKLKKRYSTSLTDSNNVFTPPRLRTAYNTNPEHNKLILSLQQNITQLEQKLIQAQDEISKLKEQIKTLQNNSRLSNICKPINYTIDCIDQTQAQQKTENTTKHKVCFLSTDRRNNLLPLIEEKFKKDYNIVHYLSSGSGIREMLRNLNAKVENYTLEDYCILIIGENDFKTTQNYIDLVTLIRDTLKTQSHTNIIICLPVYNCGYYSNVFNWRVETFNNLLYLDVSTHEYAYIMDSNSNLSYDYDMFPGQKGYINELGLRTILSSTYNLIENIKANMNRCTMEEQASLNETQNNDNFFLV